MTPNRPPHPGPGLPTLPLAPLLLAIAIVSAAGAPAAGSAPRPQWAPDALEARIEVDGRTSTAGRIDVIRTGQWTPPSFASPAIRPTPGYDWYISRHFALKTNLTPDRAREALTVLELAFPHYITAFGGVPEGLEQRRLPIVFASSRVQFRAVLATDGLPTDVEGGGITYEQRSVSYLYASGDLEYHHRYLLLHEAAHLFQVCLTGSIRNTPRWYYEGVADVLASHVYDRDKRQLTVAVLDKPTIPNYLETALAEMADGLDDGRRPTLGAMHQGGSISRSFDFLATHFFLSTPERATALHAWRDGMFQADLRGHEAHRELSGQLLTEHFGPWEQLEDEFTTWAAARRASFHQAQWGFEQDGPILRSRPGADRTAFSQMNVHLAPGESAPADPWRLDYPRRQPPDWLLDVAGNHADALLLVDFSAAIGRGEAGLGLAVDAEHPGAAADVRVLVHQGVALVVESNIEGLEPARLDLPAPFRRALRERGRGHRTALAIHVEDDALRITAHLPPGREPIEPAELTLALHEPARRLIRENPITLLSRSASHRLELFIPPPPPDEPLAERWQFQRPQAP